MIKKSRIYDVIGAVLATLIATLVIEKYSLILIYFSSSVSFRIYIFILIVSVLAFLSSLFTWLFLNKRRTLEINEKNEAIDKLNEKLQSLEERTAIDELTGAQNSNQVSKILNDRIEKAKLYNSIFTGLIIDIDNFSQINKLYGQEAGNAVLQQLGFIIKPRSNEDVLIRYGGDEFLIFTRVGDTKQAGYGLGQRLKNEVHDYEFRIDERNQKREKLTISCGVTEFKIDIDTSASFLERLSKALLSAKKNKDGTDKKNFVALES